MARGYTEPRSNWGTTSGADMVKRPTVHREVYPADRGRPERIRYHMDTAPNTERARIAAIFLDLEDVQNDFIHLSGGSRLDAMMALFDGCGPKTKALVIAKMQASLIGELIEENQGETHE